MQTKPFHSSQTLEETRENGSVSIIRVVLNLELERELLGFGEALEVLEPPRLRERIAQRLHWAGARYMERGHGARASARHMERGL